MSQDPSSQTSLPDKGGGAASKPHRGAEITDSSPADEDQRPVVPSPDAQKTVISKRSPSAPQTLDRAATPIELGEALEGHRLGHFHLEQFVGGGGMGAVFRATDTMLGRTVAVKVVSGEQTDEETLRRFRNEAQSAARLDHPNIARVYYVGEDEGWNYIVFEFIEGINIRDLVDLQGPISVEDTVSYTLQIAEALDHAWQREVIHRDIKPSNILVLPDGRAKLVDMGLARFQQVESSAEDLTASGVTLGTFDYISPEQARDPRNTDVRSDLYSLGCTMFYMLSGQPPFPDGTVLQKLLSHSSDAPPDIHQLRPDIGDEVASIIDRLLAKSPEDRFQSPSELIGQLILAADHLGLSNLSAGSTVWIAPQQSTTSMLERNLPWIVPVLALVAAVVLMELLSGPAAPVDLGPPRFSAGVYRPSETEPTSDPADRPSQAPALRESTPSDNGVRTRTNAAPTDSERASLPTGGETEPSPETDGSSAAVPASISEVAPSPEASTDMPQPADTVAEPAETLVADRLDADTTMLLEEGPRLIVVSEEEVDLDARSLRVESVQAALQTAAALSSVAEIELRFDGTRLLRPIDLRLDNSPDRDLLIRAAGGYRPQLLFDPSAGAPWPDLARTMIDVRGGQLTWSGIDFHLRVPDLYEPSGAWALFDLRNVSLLEFRHCTLTIEYPVDSRSTVTQSAAFIRVPATANRNSPESTDGLDRIKVWMEHSIARGQATLAHVQSGGPFQLFWHHGAFFSTERLIVIETADRMEFTRPGRSNLDLQRVFTATSKGLGLLDAASGAASAPELATNCFDCLFACQSPGTLPAPPVFEVRGGPAGEAPFRPLEINGSNNFYKGYEVFAEFVASDDLAAVRQYTFEDLRDAAAALWFHERSPQSATMFSWPTPRVPVHAQTLDDYLGNTSDGEAFTYTLGFEPTQLPSLPATNVNGPDRRFDWDWKDQ